ncbi:MAG: DUF1826 domain-containing protein [Pseudomonadota bacterium]|nr:DUF1826 domain-containing protein [Pseudomonadota bacterium]
MNSSENYQILRIPELLQSEDCREIAYALPSTFVFHFLRKDWSGFESSLTRKLRKALDTDVDTDGLVAETSMWVRAIAECTGADQPLASLRIVTPEYLERESPSVSRYFHRDSTAVTVTKVYFGEGAVYAENENVRREYFSTRSIQSPDVPDEEILFDPHDTHVVEDGAAVLLKGEVYPDIDARSREVIDMFVPPDRIPDFNRGNGFIHKGGGFGMGDRRLVFTASIYF